MFPNQCADAPLSHRIGFRLLREHFAEGPALAAVRCALERTVSDKDAARAADWAAGMLWYHGARSTEYFARFVEAKEAAAAARAAAELKP